MTKPRTVCVAHPAVLRALFDHMLEHAEVIGADDQGRPVLRLQLVLEPRLMDRLEMLETAGRTPDDAVGDQDARLSPARAPGRLLGHLVAAGLPELELRLHDDVPAPP